MVHNDHYNCKITTLIFRFSDYAYGHHHRLSWSSTFSRAHVPPSYHAYDGDRNDGHDLRRLYGPCARDDDRLSHASPPYYIFPRDSRCRDGPSSRDRPSSIHDRDGVRRASLRHHLR